MYRYRMPSEPTSFLCQDEWESLALLNRFQNALLREVTTLDSQFCLSGWEVPGLLEQRVWLLLSRGYSILPFGFWIFVVSQSSPQTIK